MRRVLTNNRFHNPFQNRFNDPVKRRIDEMQSSAYMQFLRERNQLNQETSTTANSGSQITVSDESGRYTSRPWGRIAVGLFGLLLIVLATTALFAKAL
jgi:hypothetical protein